ncbi:MAG TPA: DUF1858 domain-containing protein [Acholeplasmataceae bacterium]|jgi:hypothetical protein|nr:DUF1858 domain-containing protein [Acholeplasmataceae bacterium]
MEHININEPIKNLIEKHPIIKDIMLDLGFKHIVDPMMLNTVGRFMTIKLGAKKHKLELEAVKEKFLEKGFILEDTNE